MNTLGKIVIVGGVAVALLYGANNLLRLKERVEAEGDGGIDDVGLWGVRIKLLVRITNPTASSVTIKYPFFRLIYGGKRVAMTEPLNKDILISPYGRTTIENIYMTIPMTELGTSLLNYLQKGKILPLVLKVMTSIKTLFGDKPIDLPPIPINAVKK